MSFAIVIRNIIMQRFLWIIILYFELFNFALLSARIHHPQLTYYYVIVHKHIENLLKFPFDWGFNDFCYSYWNCCLSFVLSIFKIFSKSFERNLCREVKYLGSDCIGVVAYFVQQNLFKLFLIPKIAQQDQERLLNKTKLKLK